MKHLLDDVEDSLEIPQEIHLLATVEHPNVVRLLGISTFTFETWVVLMVLILTSAFSINFSAIASV
jgi:hypothetical protein